MKTNLNLTTLFIVATLLLSIAKSTQAQTPWRAKIIGHFWDHDSQTVFLDTLWFGCDSLGDEGYQQGLDEIDTSFKLNAWYIRDVAIKNQLGILYNYNTRKNIKAFNYSQPIVWQTGENGTLIKISWDTNDFKYQYKSTRLQSFGVSCNGCSIGSWHVQAEPIVELDPVTGELRTYGRNVTEILEGGLLSFRATFEDTLRTGINGPELSLSNFIQVNNPFKEELSLTFIQPATGQLQLYNTLGQVLYAQHIPSTQTTSLPINTQHLAPGVYYLTYTLNQTNQTLLQKLVKY